METYAYSSAKAAVHQLTRHLAKRLAPKVTVNAIAPGPFESKMMAATLESFGDSIKASAPMKRIGRPEDMAAAAIYLALARLRLRHRRDPPGRRRHRHRRVAQCTVTFGLATATTVAVRSGSAAIPSEGAPTTRDSAATETASRAVRPVV